MIERTNQKISESSENKLAKDDELTDLGLKIAASLKTYEEILEFINIHKRNI